MKVSVLSSSKVLNIQKLKYLNVKVCFQHDKVEEMRMMTLLKMKFAVCLDPRKMTSADSWDWTPWS